MTRQDELNEAWCKYRGKCSTEIMQALAFALRWADAHPNWEAITKRLQEEITNDLRQDRWISVEEELPPKKTGEASDKVLVYDAETNRVGASWYIHSTGKWFNGWDSVTHWMPLPDEPVVSKQENTTEQ